MSADEGESEAGALQDGASQEGASQDGASAEGASAEGASPTRARIVVGVDGSAHSRRALRWAAYLAAGAGAQVIAVSAWDYPYAWGVSVVPFVWDPREDMEKALTEVVNDTFGSAQPVGVELALRQGNAARVLLDASVGALLLVVGSRGHGGFAGLLLGSVSANVAEHAPCPVLVIHGDHEPPKRLGPEQTTAIMEASR